MNLKNKIPRKFIIINSFFLKIGRLSSRFSVFLDKITIFINKNKNSLKLNQKLINNNFYKYTGKFNKSIYYKFYYSIQSDKYLINNIYSMLPNKYKNNYKNILYSYAYF